MKKPRILVVGSINMDLILHMKELPRRGEAILADTYHYLPGGKGENQATAAALLGAESFFCGKTGDDDNGRLLRQGLAARGVDVQGLFTAADAPTGLAAILVEDSGENRMAVYPGANMKLTPDDVIPVVKRLQPDALMIQFEIPEETVIETCRAAHRMNVPVVVDAGPAMRFPIESLGNPLVLSPNETETSALCGIYPDTQAGTLKAAEILMARSNAGYVVIKQGGRGAFLYDGNDTARTIPAIPVKAVDPTAAGDAFTAALTVHFVKHRDMPEAVRFANYVGALTVTKTGALASLPHRDEVDRFIAETKKENAGLS